MQENIKISKIDKKRNKLLIYIYIYIYISEHKQNAHNDGNRAQPLKWLFETLFLAIKKCTGFTTDAI